MLNLCLVRLKLLSLVVVSRWFSDWKHPTNKRYNKYNLITTTLSSCCYHLIDSEILITSKLWIVPMLVLKLNEQIQSFNLGPILNNPSELHKYCAGEYLWDGWYVSFPWNIVVILSRSWPCHHWWLNMVLTNIWQKVSSMHCLCKCRSYT